MNNKSSEQYNELLEYENKIGVKLQVFFKMLVKTTSFCYKHAIIFNFFFSIIFNYEFFNNLFKISFACLINN